MQSICTKQDFSPGFPDQTLFGNNDKSASELRIESVHELKRNCDFGPVFK